MVPIRGREMSQLREHREHALFNLITSQLLPYFVYPYWPALANPKLAHNSGKRAAPGSKDNRSYFFLYYTSIMPIRELHRLYRSLPVRL